MKIKNRKDCGKRRDVWCGHARHTALLPGQGNSLMSVAPTPVRIFRSRTSDGSPSRGAISFFFGHANDDAEDTLPPFYWP